MELQKDLKEFIELLNSEKVKYVIIGGYAIAHYGYPRFTGDIDLWVESSQANADSLENVLKKFGFEGADLSAKDFLQPETVLQLGRAPNRIDILTSATGVNFKEAWESRVNTHFNGVPVFVISKELLIQNKKAVHRPQDLADLKQISKEESS